MRTITGTLTMLVWPVALTAAPVVTMTSPIDTVPPAEPDPVDQLIWTATAVQQLLGDRDYPLALALGLVNRTVERRGMAGAHEAIEVLAELQRRRDAFQGCRSVEPLEGTLCALEHISAFTPRGLRGELAEEAARLVGLALRPPGAPVGQVGPAAMWGPLSGLGAPAAPLIPGIAGHAGVGGQAVIGTQVGAVGPAGHLAGFAGLLLDPLQRYAEQELEQAWQSIVGDPLVALAGRLQPRDEVGVVLPAEPAVALLEHALREAVGASPLETAVQILSGNVALRGLLERYPVLGSAHDLSSVMQHSHAFFTGVVDSAKASVRGLAAADATTAAALGGELGDWAANRSFVYLAARAASLAGGGEAERVAGAITAAGNAGADLHRLVSGFSAQLSALSGSGSLGAVGERAAMLALSGGVFGVAANLTSALGAFGAGGAQTAREVQALRGVVDTLRLELHDRFAEVDLALDSMFGVLSTNFDRLHFALAAGQEANRRELAAIHGEIAALGRGLTRLEENLHSYMQAAYDQDYHRTLVRCLEHRARHQPPFDQMDFATFSGCLAEFRVRAVREARSAILSDQATPTDDASLRDALVDPDPRNLARRLPLLARAAATRFDNPGMQARSGVANPMEWAVASQAYLSMLYDWPELARGMTADDLEDMAAVGRDLQAVVAAITVDERGAPRPAFFEAMLTPYERALDVLRGHVETLMEQHQTERLRRVPLESAVHTLGPADPEGLDLGPPPQLVEALPADLKAAAILELDSLVLTYRVAYEDSVVRDDPRRRLFVGLRPLARIHDRHHYTRARVAVDVHYGGPGRIATHAARGSYTLRRSEQMRGGHDSERARRATDHVVDLTAHFHVHDWPHFAAGTWRATYVDGAAVRRARERVEAHLRLHAGAVLDDLFATVCSGLAEPRAGATVSDASRVAEALTTLDTYRTLLAAYVSVGLSRSLETRPGLRRALVGDARLHDRSSLCGALRGGESVLRLFWLEDEPQRRLAAVRRELADAFASGGLLPEPLPIVDRTLQQLEAAARLQRVRTADPGDEP
jgi:hypothetical protein